MSATSSGVTKRARRRGKQLQAAIDEELASGIYKLGIADLTAEGLEPPEIDATMDEVIADARKCWKKGASISD